MACLLMAWARAASNRLRVSHFKNELKSDKKFRRRMRMRITRVTAIFVAIVASAFGGWGLDAVKASRTANTVQDRDPMKPLQHVVASKTAKFGTVDKDDGAYKNALDA